MTIILATELETCEKAHGKSDIKFTTVPEMIITDPLWLRWMGVCQRWSDCPDIECPLSHPEYLGWTWKGVKCKKPDRNHQYRSGGTCMQLHKIDTEIRPEKIITTSEEDKNSYVVEWILLNRDKTFQKNTSKICKCCLQTGEITETCGKSHVCMKILEGEICINEEGKKGLMGAVSMRIRSLKEEKEKALNRVIELEETLRAIKEFLDTKNR